MIPGCWAVPVIVWVFPQPVAPYAKTVALYPSSTLSSRPLVVASYTSPWVVFSSKTRSNPKVWSFTLFPIFETTDRENFWTALSSGGSKTLESKSTSWHILGLVYSQAFVVYHFYNLSNPLATKLGSWNSCKWAISKKHCAVIAFCSASCKIMQQDVNSRTYICAASRIVKGRTRTMGRSAPWLCDAQGSPTSHWNWRSSCIWKSHFYDSLIQRQRDKKDNKAYALGQGEVWKYYYSDMKEKKRRQIILGRGRIVVCRLSFCWRTWGLRIALSMSSVFRTQVLAPIRSSAVVR